jgi:hypothetical protein
MLAGCGGGSSAHDVLSETAARLGRIQSGTLDMRLVLTPRGKAGRGDIGFTLHGPFTLRRGGLPVLHMTYTQLAGTRSATATLVSDGRTAYAESAGRRIPLSATQVAELRGATQQLQSGPGVRLPIEDWIDHPKVSGGGEVGGADTDHVSAGLDVVNAANGLLGLVRAFGTNAPTLTGKSAQQLRDAVRSSSFDLWTGKKDRLLRRLRIAAQLGFDVPPTLSRALGRLVGAKLEFELAVSNPKT